MISYISVMHKYSPPSRKAFLRLLGGQVALLAARAENPLTVAGKRPMIVHNEYPEDLETPLEAFNTWLTPNDAFFVRQHLPRPKVDVKTWKLELGGQVEKPLSLSLSDLRGFRQYTVPATLECTGNGRGFFQPAMPGLPWKRGGMGNAEWRGVRLMDLLAAARPKSGTAYVDADGADIGVAKTPNFIRSIAMRKALKPSTLIALEMNGEPMPEINGGPTRLIVPGWNGANWVKWVNKLDVVAQANNGFYMNPAYRYPKHPVPPGGSVKPEDLETLETMPVKSFIVNPASGGTHKGGPLEIRGVAWAGEQRIARVDVSVDRGRTWKPAQLGKEDYESSWRLWKYEWTPSENGHHVLMCRATDRSGATQPLDAAWNPSGYLWNSVDRVGVLVGG